MTFKTALLITIVAIFLGLILAKNQPAHVKYQTRKNQITNIDFYECTRRALDKHHSELLGVKTISTKDKKYLRVSVQDKNNKKWEVDCDLVTHDLISDRSQ
jgi:hypothetical protein